MLPDFFLRSLFAGIVISSISGPLGAFMIWKRMSYFGDTLAHSSLLGVTMALFFNFSPFIGVIFTSLILGVVLVILQEKINLATDTILGILSHGSLAVGLLAISLIDDFNVNILSYLYGDILTVTNADIYSMLGMVTLVFLLVYIYWDDLLLSTLDPSLAQVEGVNVKKVNLIYVIMLSSVIAIGIKILGVLLIMSLLIIPPAIANNFSRTPRHLVISSSCLSISGTIVGLLTSYEYNLPAGPTIVVVLSVILLATLYVNFLINKKSTL